MAISGVSGYQDALYSWQAQQLKATGKSSTSSSAANALSGLFDGASLTSQISSMVELTKYAMNAMGLSSDSRVTFSQIGKYREQLQNEFNEGVKKGLEQSGIQDLSSLSLELDKNGKLTAQGANEADRKTAQAWLDANPSFGEDLLKALPKDTLSELGSVKFRIYSSGRMSVINNAQDIVQESLNREEKLAGDFRAALKEMGVSTPLELIFDESGALLVKGEHEKAGEINAWLAQNPELAKKTSEALEKQKAPLASVTLRLNDEGPAAISINNAALNDIQDGLNKAEDIGKKIYSALDNLGIDPDINFSIQVDENGALKIISDHPDREKIQRFFEDNPELVKKYRQIETLAGIDDARKAMQISPSAMRKRIQIESMASWWADSGSTSSYFGSFNSGSLSLMTGLNLKV